MPPKSNMQKQQRVSVSNNVKPRENDNSSLYIKEIRKIYEKEKSAEILYKKMKDLVISNHETLMMLRFFESFDTNKNGILDLNEVKSIIQGMKLDSNKLRSLHHSLDYFSQSQSTMNFADFLENFDFDNRNLNDKHTIDEIYQLVSDGNLIGLDPLTDVVEDKLFSVDDMKQLIKDVYGNRLDKKFTDEVIEGMIKSAGQNQKDDNNTFVCDYSNFCGVVRVSK